MVSFSYVEAGPQELGPNVVCDYTRVRTYETSESTGRGEDTPRIEAPWNPFPFLAIAEEDPASAQKASLCPGHKRLSKSPWPMDASGPLAYGHSPNLCDPFGSNLAGPQFW